MDDENLMSDAFNTFLKDSPEYSKAWMEAVEKLDAANTLDKKTKTLAYLPVLASSGLLNGIPLHVKHAKSYGAKRDEIIGAVLVGLPAVGHRVIQALPVAINAYDAE